ncbi:MAG TPA: DNA primase [Polyangia bacterium]|nr:DNA primase [Polyangia bacterium]
MPAFRLGGGELLPLVPREKIDDVRERTNIVEVVKRYVELKRAGTGQWKGRCPFHSEKTPSFYVHETRHFYNCFGCHESGDVIRFLEKIEQRSFMEVLTDLASAAGVELESKPLTEAERRARREAESERDRMFRVMETAAQFFQEQYAAPGGEAARAYVAKRGISDAVAARFRVGYAPAGWNGLSAFLASKKIPASDLERLGLVGVNERGRFDFFRDRVMLPVIDRQKRVIGFGGRVLDPEIKDRKYVNSPDSPLFHKKESLYGLHAALDAIRKSGVAILVEGNFDVMSLHEAGVEDAVAPMGTALTSEQIAILGKLAKTVVVVFDGDAAGQRAAQKVIPMFVEADVDGRIARMPAGIDPDDYVRKNGGPAFRRLVDGARPMLDQFIQDAAAEPSIPGKVQALETVAELLVKVRNQTTRELYAQQLAGVLGLSNQQVTRALREAQAKAARPMPARDAEAAAAPAPLAPAVLPVEELSVIVVLATYPRLLRTADAARAGDLLLHPALRQLLRAANDQVTTAGELDVTAWLEVAAPQPDVRMRVAAAMMDDSLAKTDDAAGLLRKLATRLELSRVDAEIAMNDKLLAAARGRGDEEQARSLIRRGMELTRTKLGLKGALERP